MDKPKLPEPWLRGTLSDVPPVQRAVLHALELAKEDLERWCGDLSDEELNARPGGIAPVAFHLRHIVGSTDRLLSYAEGNSLNSEQIASMKAELEGDVDRSALSNALARHWETAANRVGAFSPDQLCEARAVGRQQMPTTVAGLLVHVADHTMRHVGQAITTAKIVKSRPVVSEIQ
jgi:uncharacterized damage-inducible protein DinB